MSYSGSTIVVPLNPSLRSKKAREGSEHDIRSLQGAMDVFRTILRDWRKHLTPQELSLVLFIADQTVGWRREAYLFTYREMKDGNPVSAGTGFSREMLKRHIRRLKDLGVIRVSADVSAGLTIALNLHWQSSGEGTKMLPTPKRLQQKIAEIAGNGEGWAVIDDPTPGSQTTPPPGHGRPPIIEEYLEGVDKRNNPCGSSDDDREGWESSAEENSSPETTSSLPLGSVRKRTRPSAQKTEQDVPAENFAPGFTDPLFSEDEAPALPVRQRSRPSAKELAAHCEAKRAEVRTRTNPGSVASTFAEASARYFSDIEGIRQHTLTRVELGKLKQGLCKDWAGEAEQLHQFIEHAIANWTQIVAENFHWMTQPAAPCAPDLLFLNWRRKDFIDAWNQRARSSWLDKIDNLDRRRYHTLTKVHGMDHNAAILKIAKEKAVRETREEVDEKLAEAKRHHATAQGIVKRREREERVAVSIPQDAPIMQELQKLREENARLKARQDNPVTGETLHPGANFEVPEWKED